MGQWTCFTSFGSDLEDGMCVVGSSLDRYGKKMYKSARETGREMGK